MLRVSEIFGPTIQGEGPSTGRHCLFVRLSRCNLSCAWCDTPYTWAHTDAKAAKHRDGLKFDIKQEETEFTVDQVLARIRELWPIDDRPTLIVISGGEPMLQQKELKELIEKLDSIGCTVEIETAGTLMPDEDLEYFVEYGALNFNTSPKLAGSGNKLVMRRKPDVLTKLRDLGAAFKFVVTNDEDKREVEEIVDELSIPRDQVWIMPEGITADVIAEHARWLADWAINEHGWNLSQRVHVTIWGTERAR